MRESVSAVSFDASDTFGGLSVFLCLSFFGGAVLFQRAIVRQHAEPARDFSIGLLDLSHVVSESVFVEFFLTFAVPQPAGIGRDFVGEPNGDIAVFFDAASELEFEVDEPQSDGSEDALQEVVCSEREREHVVDFLGMRPAEGGDVVFGDGRVGEFVVFQTIFDDGARQHGAFFAAVAFGEAACGDVAHDHFEGDHFQLADELFAHVDAVEEVVCQSDLGEGLEHVFGDEVVQHAFAFDGGAFRVVESGGVVLEVLDERRGIGTRQQDLRFPFVERLRAVWHFAHAERIGG